MYNINIAVSVHGICCYSGVTTRTHRVGGRGRNVVPVCFKYIQRVKVSPKCAI